MDNDNGYIYLEECNNCDICYEVMKEFFKCNICTFKSCPQCFNNIYFEETNKCPQCRIIK